jgi:hypothetical protein
LFQRRRIPAAMQNAAAIHTLPVRATRYTATGHTRMTAILTADGEGSGSGFFPLPESVSARKTERPGRVAAIPGSDHRAAGFDAYRPAPSAVGLSWLVPDAVRPALQL